MKYLCLAYYDVKKFEARDLNEAILIASKHPAAHLGEDVGWAVEVRPIDFFQQS